MSPNKKTQSGSVFLYVLIGVVLFSMVVMAAKRNDSSTEGTMSKAKAKTVATDILDYSNAVASAVQKLITKGCSENEISFENPVVAGYENPYSPNSGDKRCWVFSTTGGNLTYRKAAIGNLYINGLNRINNVGKSSSDLILFIIMTSNDTNVKVCKEINKSLGITASTVPEDSDMTYGTPFIGTYVDGAVIGDEDTLLDKKSAACFRESSGSYYFYNVLLVR